MENNLMLFANQSYLNLETFRKNGEGVKTPVWFVQADGKLYVRTVSSSGKVKRARNQARVRVVPCGQSGEPLGEWVAGKASELSDANSAQLVRRLLVEKYGDMVAMFEARTRAAGQEYTVLLIETGV